LVTAVPGAQRRIDVAAKAGTGFQAPSSAGGCNRQIIFRAEFRCGVIDGRDAVGDQTAAEASRAEVLPASASWATERVIGAAGSLRIAKEIGRHRRAPVIFPVKRLAEDGGGVPEKPAFRHILAP
jgi:hypothetical protein